ncbi:MAG: hypothetical protein OXP71_02395 [Candidatus Poribacteria bacterium]|nr:hypothetical protein [Candidatus Poribacteria bacterium]
MLIRYLFYLPLLVAAMYGWADVDESISTQQQANRPTSITPA